MSRMGRPKEHNAATRAALLQAAEQMIATHGMDALSIRGVADAVGTTTRAVYSLFESKAGLLQALAVRLFELLDEAIGTVALTDDPREDLAAAAIDGFRRVAIEHPSLYSLVFLRVVPDLQLGSDFSAVASATFARLEALVARVAEDDAGDIDVPQLALAVHALTEGLASVELRQGVANPAAEQLWHDSVIALVDGFPRAADDQ